MNDYKPTGHCTPHDLDRLLHTQLARLAQGISPASLVGDCMDWLAHLAMSPVKQQELLAKAVRKADVHYIDPDTWLATAIRR